MLFLEEESRLKSAGRGSLGMDRKLHGSESETQTDSGHHRPEDDGMNLMNLASRRVWSICADVWQSAAAAAAAAAG